MLNKNWKMGHIFITFSEYFENAIKISEKKSHFVLTLQVISKRVVIFSKYVDDFFKVFD